MTVETFTPAAAYTVAGIGPYAIGHPYLEGSIRIFTTVSGAEVELPTSDYSLSPVAATVSGNLFLTPAAAAAQAGRELRIRRVTPPEQGWVGVQGEREKGLERQLDRLTYTVQENSALQDRTLRTRDPIAQLILETGRTLLFNGTAIVPGPNAADIAAAQPNAAAAQASAAAAASSAAAAALFNGPWLNTPTALIADNSLGYAASGGNLVTPGQYVQTRDGFSYVVAASAASDHHLITAGGVKLYVRPGARGMNVRAFGAVGNGITNDRPAFIAAISAVIAAGGGAVYVPASPASYRIVGQLAFTFTAKQSLAIVGDGRAVSVIDFSGAAALGFAFTSTSVISHTRPQFDFSGVSIVTSRANSGAGIRVSYANADNLNPSVTINDAFIGQNIYRGEDLGAGFGFFTQNVWLTNARNSRLRNVQLLGEISNATPTQHGVLLDGECTATQIVDSLLMEGITGVEATGATEGVSVINCDTLYFRYGLRHNIVSGAEPQFTVIGGSVNCANVNIWLTNSQQSVVSGVLHYAAAELDAGPWPAWTGVLMDGALNRDNRVTGCVFSKSTARTGDATTCIDFNNGRSCLAEGNQFRSFIGNEITVGIAVRSGFVEATISPDNQYSYLTQNVSVNAGATFSPVLQQVLGGVTGAITTGTTVTLPQGFPNNMLSVVAVHAGTNTAVNVTTAIVSKSSFVVHHNAGSAVLISWVATGN